MIRPQSPGLEFVFAIQADIAPPRNAGTGPLGQRLHIPILGGQVTGPRLTGRILPGGSDWPVLGPDGNTRIMAHYTIEASDGGLIYVHNEGLRVSSSQALDQIRAGQDPGHDQFYMRAAPRFDVADGPHQWLRLSLFVCALAPVMASVSIDVYRIT